MPETALATVAGGHREDSSSAVPGLQMFRPKWGIAADPNASERDAIERRAMPANKQSTSARSTNAKNAKAASADAPPEGHPLDSYLTVTQ